MLNPQCVWLIIIFFLLLRYEFCPVKCPFCLVGLPFYFSTNRIFRGIAAAIVLKGSLQLLGAAPGQAGSFDGIHWRLIIFPRKTWCHLSFHGVYRIWKDTPMALLMMLSLYWGSKKEIGDESVLLKTGQQFSRFFSFRQWVFRWHQEVELPAGGELPLWLAGEVVLSDQIVTSHVRMLL